MTLTEILTEIKEETGDSALTLTRVVPILQALQTQYIQPRARIPLTPVPTLVVAAATATYSLATNVSTSIYKVLFLTETKSGDQIPFTNLLHPQDVAGTGLRLFGDTIYNQLERAATLNWYCEKKLTVLDATNGSQVPDIDTDFHDLYVMGGTARIDRRKDKGDYPETVAYWKEFQERLFEFEKFMGDKYPEEPLPMSQRPRW